MLISCAIILAVVGLRLVSLERRAQSRELLPHEILDSSLDSGERVLYQSLIAAASEILWLREESGAWPASAQLEEQALPPFASQFLPRELQEYQWTGRDAGTWIDYLGVPSPPSEQAVFLLRLLDLQAESHPHPHPEFPPEQMFAFQIWRTPKNPPVYPLESLVVHDWKLLLPSREAGGPRGR